jgi:hypothetical protein
MHSEARKINYTSSVAFETLLIRQTRSTSEGRESRRALRMFTFEVGGLTRWRRAAARSTAAGRSFSSRRTFEVAGAGPGGQLGRLIAEDVAHYRIDSADVCESFVQSLSDPGGGCNSGAGSGGLII